MAGGARGHDIARRLLATERQIETNGAVETVVLSLSVNDERSRDFSDAAR